MFVDAADLDFKAQQRHLAAKFSPPPPRRVFFRTTYSISPLIRKFFSRTHTEAQKRYLAEPPSFTHMSTKALQALTQIYGYCHSRWVRDF
jgi:hypothetical protein